MIEGQPTERHQERPPPPPPRRDEGPSKKFKETNASRRKSSSHHREDRWIWNLKSSGNFFVASIRSAFNEMSLKKGSIPTRWNHLVPQKSSYRQNPDAREYGQERYPHRIYALRLCKTQPENGNHIFATFPKTTEVRREINRWWFDAFPNPCSSLTEAYAWARNDDATFNGHPFNSLRAGNDIQSFVYSWFHNRSKDENNLNWID
ncbi:hypothetical protein OSB04_031434 [Centaurea solstitialis]|uniref:Uncharacterized protein n=1 Tax=Centaurea solstitialis TaxID=347529 RepID=A0AA38W842_9ASTR|nr:hypothetical protein OSB04_031434 [Centaurea solstitialis]